MAKNNTWFSGFFPKNFRRSMVLNLWELRPTRGGRTEECLFGKVVVTFFPGAGKGGGRKKGGVGGRGGKGRGKKRGLGGAGGSGVVRGKRKERARERAPMGRGRLGT